MGEAGRILSGSLAGALFGIAVAMLGAYISSRGLCRENSGVMAVMFVRMLLDIVALSAVYFLRNVLPLSFEPTIIGTALGLSVTGIITGWKLSRRLAQDKQAEDARTEGGE